jgi:hypothetical protein
LEDPGRDERIILNAISRNKMGALTGLIWFRIEISGGLM